MKIQKLKILGSWKSKSKKGDVSETLIWFGAVFVIFFIMIIFLVFAFGSVIQKINKKNEILINANNRNLEFQAKFFYFLNSPIEYEDKTMSVMDFASLAEKDNTKQIEKFKEIADSFIKESSYETYGIYRVWVRIYKNKDKTEQYYTNNFYFYQYSFDSNLRGGSGGILCKPEEMGAILFQIELNQGKKIVLCANSNE